MEELSVEKNEYFDGHILAMAGGSPEHAFLASRMILALGKQLQGKPCQPYGSDLRARVEATSLTTYPDVLVVCGRLRRDPEDPHSVLNPTVIVEVLSPSTEAYDRGEKFRHYRQIPSLKDYVLVSQGQAQVDHFERQSDDRWLLRSAGAGEQITLASIGCVVAVDALYEGVEQARE